MNIKTSREYLEFGFNIVRCPACGQETLDNHFLCPYCNWEYDGDIDENTPSASNSGFTPHEYLEYLINVNEKVDS